MAPAMVPNRPEPAAVVVALDSRAQLVRFLRRHPDSTGARNALAALDGFLAGMVPGGLLRPARGDVGADAPP